MKVEEFFKHLTSGDLQKLFDPEELNVAAFLSDYVFSRPVHEFLLCIHLGCGCQRVIHYTASDAELVFRPNKELVYILNLRPEFVYPKHDTGECIKGLILPRRWGMLPLVHVRVGYTHRALDVFYDALRKEAPNEIQN